VPARRTTLSLLILAFAATSASAAGTAVSPRVSPKTGGPKTAFTVSFKTRQETSRAGIIDRHYPVEISRKRRKGCIYLRSVRVRYARSGVRVRTVVRAGKRTARWCRGAFTGRVFYVEEPSCRNQPGCPSFPSTRRQVGKFSVRVR
jgi:hypothetical protein